MAQLLDFAEFEFADGGSGKVCNLGSAPSVGQWDILFVNSNTIVSTPSGFTVAEPAVNNQGAYVFVRQAVGGETDSVTVTTSGNHDCQVSWERWSGLIAVDTSTSTQANASVGGSTPAHSTGTLAETGEVSIAFAALHSISTGNQSAPVWSAGYTPVSEAKQGTGATGVVGYVAYKTGAGTAAETPSVSWSGEGAFNRYMLVITFTATASEPIEVDLDTVIWTDTAVPLGRTKQRALATLVDTASAVVLGRTKRRALATTTDTATAVTPGKTKRRALATVTETTTAIPPVGPATPAGRGTVSVADRSTVALVHQQGVSLR